MTSGGESGQGRDWITSPYLRLAAFASVLAVLAGVAALIGRSSGFEVGESTDHDGAVEAAHGGQAPPGMWGNGRGNGLSDAAAGLRLRLEPTTLRRGARSRLRLAIVDRRGEAIGELRGGHGEPPLHLILVRRDLNGYQHLHPKPNGTGYAVDVTLPQAGIWRAYADFEVEGEKVVLGRDLFVPGDFAPQSLRAVGDSDSTNGYDVMLAGREFHAGEEATLSFRIDRGGQTVEPLDPYLGADGHLVAIREDDLAYLHVHPLESSAAAGIAFAADFAEPGRYALFLQFKHEGSVQTARFTVAVAR